jgi:hypothetical protein
VSVASCSAEPGRRLQEKRSTRPTKRCAIATLSACARSSPARPRRRRGARR